MYSVALDDQPEILAAGGEHKVVQVWHVGPRFQREEAVGEPATSPSVRPANSSPNRAKAPPKTVFVKEESSRFVKEESSRLPEMVFKCGSAVHSLAFSGYRLAVGTAECTEVGPSV